MTHLFCDDATAVLVQFVLFFMQCTMANSVDVAGGSEECLHPQAGAVKSLDLVWPYLEKCTSY